jgi:hypothetical protein
MRRTLLAIIMSALAAGGMSLAQHDEHGKGGDYVKPALPEGHHREAGREEGEGHDGRGDAGAGPGGGGAPSSGPAFGYVLEGEYEWAIDDNTPKICPLFRRGAG